MLDICGGQGVYLPTSSCDDCSMLEERVAELERRLRNIREVSFEKIDGDSSQSGVFLGRVNNG